MAGSAKRAAFESPDRDNIQTKKSSQAVADRKLERFLAWCIQQNINISPKVCVEWEGVCAQYGMMAVDNISAGEILFSVPRNSLLSPETSSIATLLHQGQQEVGAGSGWVPLLLALLYEYNNPQSTWRAYLDIVPDFAQLDLPMFWSSEERSQLLQGTGVVEAVSRDLTLMEQDFQTKALPFMQKHPEIFSPSCQNLPLYQRMVAFVMAYSFTEPAGNSAEIDGKGSKADEDSDTEDARSPPPPMMVPLADILNHVANNNAELTFHENCLRMVSTRDITKGDEIFNTYGELANRHLLHMYGFAERYPDNHFDTVDIPVSTVTAVAESTGDNSELFAAKLHFLQEQELHQAGECYVLGMEGILTDDELMAVLKVLTMSAEQFQEHVEKEGWSDAESDATDSDSNPLTFDRIPQLPLIWKDLLSRCAAMCLTQLAGNEHEDAVAMETGEKHLVSRERYALYVRYGQRQLLQKLVDSSKE